MNFFECVAERLDQAQSVLDALPSKGEDPQLCWLERQLMNIISQLMAITADLEAGCSIVEMGLYTDVEFEEMIDDLGREITNLKGIIQTVKMLGNFL